MATSTDLVLALRIVVRRPLSGVAFAVQHGTSDLLQPTARTADSLIFDFSVRVAEASSNAAPRFLGKFTQGPPTGRFVYVNSGQCAGQVGSCWTRRAKIPLAGVTRDMIDAAMAVPGAHVETEFEGVGKDGGPTCASVKGIVWRVVAAP